MSEPTETAAPPSPDDPFAAHYYVHDGSGVIGPITGEKLKEMIEAGAIARDSDFNRLGDPNWTPALRFLPFSSFFKADAAPAPPNVFAQPGRQAPAPRGPYVYATFWKRLAAYAIDALILALGGFVLALVVTIFAVASSGAEAAKETIDQHELFFNGLGALIGIFYNVHFLSSPQQATPGKRIMGIYVVRKDGARLSPLFALGRYLAAGLSALILGFGFLMILWTKDRQGLHDMMCNTYVVEGKL